MGEAARCFRILYRGLPKCLSLAI